MRCKYCGNKRFFYRKGSMERPVHICGMCGRVVPKEKPDHSDEYFKKV